MTKQADILVIDDEQVIVDAVVKICSSEGFSVNTSLNASDALHKVENHNYRLIICDIMMQEIDGFQFLNELQKKKISTPVIMTTGYSTVENAVKSLYNGAIDFIPKPFTVDELLSSVQRGMKYLEIQNQLKTTNKNDDSFVLYVPCPAKYYRLGYGSWACVENAGSLLIGVTDLFLKTIDNISGIELSKIDEEIIQGNACAEIKTKEDKQHLALSPVSGRIIERNEELIHNHNIVEKDPYFKGWFYRIIPSDSEYELKHLIPCSSDRM